MIAALTIAALATSNAAHFTQDATAQKYMWEQFKQEHSKSYSAAEEPMRFQAFLDNLKLIDERNSAENGSALHGITKFADMTPQEFSSKMLNSRPNPNRANMKRKVMGAPNTSAGLVDWSDKLTTPVKDQGYCGSCWAFSATEQIESDSMRTLGTSFILSPQQITSCDRTAFGCGGGWTEHAYEYVGRTGGIEQESDYPYAQTTYSLGQTGDCTSEKSKYVIGVKSYTTIDGEDQMASYVQSTGPLSVCLDASSWNSYKGGIMSVCGNSVDHCVQAVGVDASAGGYWLVRNSWGTSWGENGYIRLAYGKDTCAISSDPTYAEVFTV